MSSYIINLPDGTLLTEILDGTLDTTSTSLVLVGRNYSGYGEYIAEDLVALLVNFAKNSAPNNPNTGQIWYDTANRIAKIYNGTTWKNIGSVTATVVAPSTTTAGDLWWDSVNKQLFCYDGTTPYNITGWILVGPGYSTVLGKSGALFEQISDGTVLYDVVSLYLNGTRTAIISQAAFTPNVAIPGFSSLQVGWNMSTTSTRGTIWGTANNASYLGNQPAANYFRNDLDNIGTGNLTILNNSGLTIGAQNNANLTITGANAVSLWNSVNNAGIEVYATTSNVKTKYFGINGSTGAVEVAADPITPLGVVTKQYVDNSLINTQNIVTAQNAAKVEQLSNGTSWFTVTSIYVDGKRAAILADSAFTPNVAIPGFSSLQVGWNMSTTSTRGTIWGTANNASYLGNQPAANYFRNNTNNTGSGSLTIQNNSGLTIGAQNNANLTITSANTVSLWNSVNFANVEIYATTGGVKTKYFSIDGSTGAVEVAADPTTQLGVATKKYVDDRLISSEVDITGQIAAKVEQLSNGTSWFTVTSIYSDSQRVAIISNNAFTPNVALLGFENLQVGWNMSTTSTRGTIWGTANNASYLGNQPAANYFRNNTNNTGSGSLTIQNNNGLTIGTQNNANLTITSANAVSLWNSVNNAGIEVYATTNGIKTKYFSVDGPTGAVEVAADPITPLGVATKKYVDGAISEIPLSITEPQLNDIDFYKNKIHSDDSHFWINDEGTGSANLVIDGTTLMTATSLGINLNNGTRAVTQSQTYNSTGDTRVATTEFAKTATTWWGGSAKFVSNAAPNSSQGNNGDFWFRYLD